jgi:hypothetical protein
MSEAEATIVGAVIGATIGGVFGLLGVWVGYYFSKRASEGDRQTELQYTIYQKVESIKNRLTAFQKEMISRETIHEKSARADSFDVKIVGCATYNRQLLGEDDERLWR